MTDPILWQNPEQTVTLLDIPHSIESAQALGGENVDAVLLSSCPLRFPFPVTNEPKSAPARAKLQNHTLDASLHDEYAELLRNALTSVRSEFKGEWCRPRPFVPDERSRSSSKKRKLGLDSHVSNTQPDSSSTGPHGSSDTPEAPLSRIARGQKYIYSHHKPTGEALPLDDDELNSQHDGLHFFSNNISQPTLLKVAPFTDLQSRAFKVPPTSSFFLGDCARGDEFHLAVRNQAARLQTREPFDFVLLDPPWPNRSVKRTHKSAGSGYAVAWSLDETKALLLDLRLESVMDDDCLVGVWITNKPSVRDLVLGEQGLFAVSGLTLVEEWLWLKTTVGGEPVTPIDSLWRKPYEVLLVGQRRSGRPAAPQDVKRRVIASVPDLHSRKPCIKQLIEPLMKSPTGYRALEVFARHLVAGWWSWGDECIKFNWEGHWREKDPVG